MSYCVYTTEAVVLKKRDVGEADRVFSFYTKDFGRIEAVAQGVRYLKSKLRYNFYGFSFLKIAFVATSNEYWRLVYTKELKTLDGLRRGIWKINSAVKVLAFLEHLVQGQEKDEELWRGLENFLFFLDRPDFQKEDLKKLESSTLSLLTDHLGYSGIDSELCFL